MNEINLEVLRVKILVIFSKSSSLANIEAEKYLGVKIGDAEEADGYSVAHLRRGVIWIGPNCKRSQVFHECYHMLNRILREINASGGDEELNAHIFEYICENALTLWEKNT